MGGEVVYTTGSEIDAERAKERKRQGERERDRHNEKGDDNSSRNRWMG